MSIEKVKEIILETCGVVITDDQAQQLIDSWNEIFGNAAQQGEIMIEISQGTLIELVEDAVSWMQAAKKSHPTLLLPAWVSQWPEFRPTKDAADFRRARGVLHIENLDVVEEIRKLRGD